MSDTQSWPAGPPDPGHYDPAVTKKLEALTAAPMDTLRHDAEQAAIADAQASAEGLTLTGLVTFKGRTFKFGTLDALAPMLDFAEAAERGLDDEDPAGLAALKSMIRDSFVRVASCGTCAECVREDYTACDQLDEGDWPRFWRLAKATRASGEELMEVVKVAMEHQAARPTQPQSGSPSPPATSSQKSKGNWRSAGPMPDAFAEAEARGDLIDIRDAVR